MRSVRRTYRRFRVVIESGCHRRGRYGGRWPGAVRSVRRD
jgi:hypothetical protein